MALFWKRKQEPAYISLGLNREATEEEKKIAERRHEGPEPDLADKLKQAVTATRETLTDRIEAVVGLKRQIDAQVLDELEEALIGADLGVQTSLDIIEKARQQVSRKQLNDVDELKRLIRDELTAILDSADRNRKRGTVASETEVPLDIKPYVVMIVGVNGVGKTTTIGKLAHRIKSESNEVLICAADTFRAAANDQLSIWAERSGVPLIQQKPGTDPSAVLFDSIISAKARNADVLIVDTAGRLHTKMNLMQELEKMRRIAGREVTGAPHEVLLVIDAVTGQNGLEQARQFTKAVPVTGLVLTKLDGTAKGGIVIAIAKELGIPIRYVGVGEQMNDLIEFSPEAYLDGLFD
ncbi:MAG: signal recognition particle-docking protein FtsY [Blastocatellia bacterium]